MNRTRGRRAYVCRKGLILHEITLIVVRTGTYYPLKLVPQNPQAGVDGDRLSFCFPALHTTLALSADR